MVAGLFWTTSDSFTLPNPYAYGSNVSITQLMNGNILVVFDSTDNSNPPHSGTNVNGFLFDPFGNQIGGILELNDLIVNGEQGASTVSALDDGGFLITYFNQDTNAAIWEEHNSATGMDAAGGIPTGFNEPVAPYDLTDATNSQLSLSTRIVLNSSTGMVEVDGRFYNNDTNGFTAPFNIAAIPVHAATFEMGWTEQAALANGDYVTVFRYTDRNGDDLVAVTHDSSGMMTGFANIILNGTDAASRQQVTALADGGFVVTWVDKHPMTNGSPYYENFTHDAYAQVFNADATARTGAMLLQENYGFDDFGSNTPRVVGFADGGFGVIWYDGLLITPDTQPDPEDINTTKEIFIRLYDANGNATLNYSIPYAGATSYEQALEAAQMMDINVAPLEDGRFVLSWYVNNQDIAEPFTLNSIILDPRNPLGAGNQPANATSGNDFIVGTTAGDTIFRSGGTDSIHGWAGNDRIEGDFADGAFYDGGLGTDIIDFGGLGPSGTVGGLVSNIVINLQSETATFRIGRNTESMTVAGFEEVRGSGFGETIIDRNSTQSADILRGGGGDDILRLTLGDDTAYGGTGDDTIEVRRWIGTKQVFGNSGNDTLDLRFISGPHDTRIDLDNGTVTRLSSSEVVTLNTIENAIGSLGDDVMIGDGGDNRLDGHTGDDVIVGGFGLDDLRGGGGNDTFQYEATDIVAGESVDGGADTDALLAAGGGTFRFDLLDITSIEVIDFLNFGTVNRTMVFTSDQFKTGGVELNALVDGNAQGGVTDTLRINLASNAVLDLSRLSFANWGDGGDVVQVFGSSGKDQVTGTSEADDIRGGGSIDVLNGGDGDDTLSGDAGEDVLNGGRGLDTLRGGEDNDLYVINDDQPVQDVIVENAGSAAGTADQIQTSVSFTNALNVEVLRGTGSANIDLTGLDAQDDQLLGNSGNNALRGLAGEDDLRGLNGNDVLIGGEGGDHMDGGAGVDTASYESSTGRVIVNLGSGLGSGGDADGDVLTGIENLKGTGRNDRLTGNNEDNLLSGGDRHDRLSGRNGADTLDGGDGDDILDGGNHDDLLIGGRGKDEMTGGSGLDNFDFNSTNQSATGSQRDMINDFSQTEGDLIDLRSIDAQVTPNGNQAFVFTGNGGRGQFSNSEGELRWFQTSSKTIVQLDVDGDGQADCEIGLAGLYTLTEADFVL